MKNNDLETFKENVSWFIKPHDNVEIKSTFISLDEIFKTEFPNLTKLVSKARVSDLTIMSKSYKLLVWDTKYGGICGWLNKFEPDTISDIDIISEHKLILNNIGGILESFNEPENTLSLNQCFLFLKSQCSRGIGDWNEYYETLCEEENLPQIDYSKFISFVQEANGALTLYDKNNRQVYLFSHDHSFENVVFLENQPQYTFHKINGIQTFTDYVETLADQWLEITAGTDIKCVLS